MNHLQNMIIYTNQDKTEILEIVATPLEMAFLELIQNNFGLNTTANFILYLKKIDRVTFLVKESENGK